MLPQHLQDKMDSCKERTSKNTGLKLVLALSYSSHSEITHAALKMAEAISNDDIDAKDVTPDTLSQFLYTKHIPDPELMIRTSGELRISNFLMWQMAYTDLYFTEIHWPDFRKDEFFTAILEYQGRERRFGKTSEQLDQE